MNEMPGAEDGFIKTLNNMGFMTVGLDRFSQAFVEFAKETSLPVIDIGAAYGVATIEALNNGATVIANDIGQAHLDILVSRVVEPHKSRLQSLCGPFPDLTVEPASVGAVLICRVLHFLDGETIDRGARAVYEWLAPGGKVFVVTETPYVGTLRTFRPEYERRKSSGDPWPGLIENMAVYTEKASALPQLANWLDVEVLTRVFRQAGFCVDECSFFARPEFPEWLQLDGRESVGLIATKICSKD